MRPLPPQRYELAEWKHAIVNIDYHIEITGHYYSVPHQLVRHKVEVRFSATTVECFFKGKRVAAHVRSNARGRHTTLPEHMPESHRKHQQWTPGRLLNWALSIGTGTRDVVRWQLENRPHPEQGYRACLGLLDLARHYGESRLEAACLRALAIGAPTRKRIKSILEAKLDQHPQLFAATTEAPVPKVSHANVRGPEYFCCTITDQGDAESCSSNPPSIP
jgi:transposase